jgi:hypothetical protein
MKKLIKRSERLSFMDVGTESKPSYARMTKFTSIKGSKNPKEYSRQYVDMDVESSDVVGYAPAIEYSFDRHTDTLVHEKIAKITDEELLGTDTYVDIVTVDVFAKRTNGQAPARKRTYSVVADSEGDGTDALVYSGNFKAVSEIGIGYATTEDEWKTITFVAGEIPE